MSRKQASQSAPASFPFVERIKERQATFSKAESAIAAYLVTNIRDIPFETAASISSKLKLSPMTVGRLLRSLGYENLAALKEELGSTIHQIAWLVGERYERMTSAERSRNEADSATPDRSASLDLELKAVISAYEQVGTERFGEVAEMVAKADRV